MSVQFDSFIHGFSEVWPGYYKLTPWELTSKLPGIIEAMVPKLGDGYLVDGNVAVHKTAVIESGVVLKGPVIISEGCFVAANAYLRGGVYVGKSSGIGPGCEIKTCIISAGTSIAHFNFIGDSIVGYNVNFEAGSIAANEYNERKNKLIQVVINRKLVDTMSIKFGALVGDNSRIGANAVLSPGTILMPNSVVRRLELVDQQSEWLAHA